MQIATFYTAALSFFVGVFITTFYTLSLPTITWLFCVGAALVFLYVKQRTTNKATSGVLYSCLVLLFFAAGALRIEVAQWNFLQSELLTEVGASVVFEGKVVTEPDKRERVTYLTIQTGNDKILVGVDAFSTVTYGDVVEVRGVLAVPTSFETDLGRTFNYASYLKAKGIQYQISFAQVQILRSNEGNVLVENLLVLKHSFMEQIERYLAEPAAGLGEGLLLGVKQGLGEELETAFRKTGIIHIVVLSGYNIMLVVVFVMTILGFFLPKKPRVFFGIAAIAAFALLVGLSATVVRASIMAVILLLTQVTSRTYLVVRGLVLAGLIMVIHNPFLLAYDVGFQLSFLATLGLIFITPHFEALLQRVTSAWNVKTFLVATLGAQVAVLPLLLYQIGEFSVVSVVVNVLVLPMVPVAMLLTFCVGLFGYISVTLATILSYPAYFSLLYIIKAAELFVQVPFAAVAVPAFPFPVVVFAYGLMVYVLYKKYDPALVGRGSELGESLLIPKTDNSKTEDELASWTIEEEFDAQLIKTASVYKTEAVDEVVTPTLFR